MQLRKHFIFYTIVLLTILFVGSSYLRFIVLQDYMISYEVECDTTVNSCFESCTDSECAEKYHYTKVQKNAANLFKQCGDSIVNCKDANVCLTEEKNQCSIRYCDPKTDGNSCAALSSKNI